MVNKHKISVSVSEETIVKIREAIRKGEFRSRSHAIEDSINKVLGEKE